MFLNLTDFFARYISTYAGSDSPVTRYSWYQLSLDVGATCYYRLNISRLQSSPLPHKCLLSIVIWYRRLFLLLLTINWCFGSHSPLSFSTHTYKLTPATCNCRLELRIIANHLQFVFSFLTCHWPLAIIVWIRHGRLLFAIVTFQSQLSPLSRHWCCQFSLAIDGVVNSHYPLMVLSTHNSPLMVLPTHNSPLMVVANSHSPIVLSNSHSPLMFLTLIRHWCCQTLIRHWCCPFTYTLSPFQFFFFFFSSRKEIQYIKFPNVFVKCRNIYAQAQTHWNK